MKKIYSDKGFESFSEARLFYLYLENKKNKRLSELLDTELKKKENQIFRKIEQNKIDYSNALEKLYSNYDDGVAVIDKYMGNAEYTSLYIQRELSLFIKFDEKQKALFDMVKKIRGKKLIEELISLEKSNAK